MSLLGPQSRLHRVVVIELIYRSVDPLAKITRIVVEVFQAKPALCACGMSPITHAQ